jgi:hypothetical protein
VARQFPAVLVTGARQTGKTTILQHLSPATSFVTLDLPSIAHLAETKASAATVFFWRDAHGTEVDSRRTTTRSPACAACAS